MKHTGEIDTRIAGIPCQIKIDYYFRQKPLGPQADSDVDCYGYTDAEYTVLDRRGYPAMWLQRKIDQRTADRIMELIYDYKEQENDD